MIFRYKKLYKIPRRVSPVSAISVTRAPWLSLYRWVELGLLMGCVSVRADAGLILRDPQIHRELQHTLESTNSDFVVYWNALILHWNRLNHRLHPWALAPYSRDL